MFTAHSVNTAKHDFSTTSIYFESYLFNRFCVNRMNVFSVFLECIQPTYVSVFILILIVSLCYTVLCWRRPSDLPPGPKFYPIIGNMRTVGQKTLVGAFRDWRKEFGDIFSVSLGSKWVIVICGLENLKEAFVERDDVFSDRPDLFVNRYINEKRGMFCIIIQIIYYFLFIRRFPCSTNAGFAKPYIKERLCNTSNTKTR